MDVEMHPGPEETNEEQIEEENNDEEKMIEDEEDEETIKEEEEEEPIEETDTDEEVGDQLSDPKCETQMLVMPGEAVEAPIHIVSKDKEMCARLEDVMVQWIRQIKEVLGNQSMQNTEDLSGPLEEIVFWKKRKYDLYCLAKQVRNTEVRTVQRIMTIIKSPFVPSFNDAANEILSASNEAIMNLHYLSVLIEPCKKLKKSKVSQVPPQLRKILWLTRVIWLNSPNYNTKERLNGLLRKVSSQIIKHCIKEIDVDKVFDGYIDACEGSIINCSECLQKWKKEYMDQQKMHNMNSYLTWLLEYDHIFFNVDVFHTRLQNLLEICACQRLYGRRTDGVQEPLPKYPGMKAAEITKVMKKIQDSLDRALEEMRPNRHMILDVFNNQWHDYMLMFKATVRDVETMIQNVLFLAFDSVVTLEEGIELLSTFYMFYQRDIIGRAYDKLVTKLYKIFEDEMNTIKNQFATLISPAPTGYPKYAARAAWTLYLTKRLDTQLGILTATWWLPQCGYGDDTKEQAKGVSRSFGKFVQIMYEQWCKSLGTHDLYSRLELPLMKRSATKFGMIEVNFDPTLSKYLVEAELWETMNFPVPEVLLNVYYERERLQEMQETVLKVVEDYNSTLSSLSPEERQLFRERIKVLGRKIYPGLTKLIWSSDVSESYTKECKMASNKVKSYIQEYKNANKEIEKLAKKMSNILMIQVNQKETYKDTSFNDAQDVYRSKAILKMAQQYKKITYILRDLFEMFKTDGNEVKVQWMKYLKKIDKIVEEAFVLSLRKSLEVLSFVVHGDFRGPPPPIFELTITLQDNQLNFDPPVPVLEDMILGIFRRICISLTAFPRVIQFLNDPTAQVISFSQTLSKDETARSIQDRIAEGVKTFVAEIEKYLSTWEPYKDIWQLNKGTFMELYGKQNPPTSSYEADIDRYNEVMDAIQGCESEVAISLCIINCRVIRDILVEQCKEWRLRFLNSLYTRGAEKLTEVFAFMKESLTNFKKQPKTLLDLANAIRIYKEMRTSAASLEKTFPKIMEHFTLLKKYEYEIVNPTKSKLRTFNDDWNRYNENMQGVEDMLRQAKDDMMNMVVQMADEFKEHVEELSNSFQAMDWSQLDSEDAIAEARKFRGTITQLRKEERGLMESIQFFKMDLSASDDLLKVELQLERMENLLGISPEEEEGHEEHEEEDELENAANAASELKSDSQTMKSKHVAKKPGKKKK